MSLILVVEVNAEVLLASALASEITATTFVALEATTPVSYTHLDVYKRQD